MRESGNRDGPSHPFHRFGMRRSRLSHHFVWRDVIAASVLEAPPGWLKVIGTVRPAKVVPKRVGDLPGWSGTGSKQHARSRPPSSRLDAEAVVHWSTGEVLRKPDAKDKLRKAFEAAEQPVMIEVYTLSSG